jgi:hypothetical protein
MALRTATAVVVVLVFVALAITPRPAVAGGYDVFACDMSVGGGANNSFAAVADGGMAAYTNCPGPQGLVARDV